MTDEALQADYHEQHLKAVAFKAASLKQRDSIIRKYSLVWHGQNWEFVAGHQTYTKYGGRKAIEATAAIDTSVFEEIIYEIL